MKELDENAYIVVQAPTELLIRQTYATVGAVKPNTAVGARRKLAIKGVFMLTICCVARACISAHAEAGSLRLKHGE